LKKQQNFEEKENKTQTIVPNKSDLFI